MRRSLEHPKNPILAMKLRYIQLSCIIVLTGMIASPTVRNILVPAAYFDKPSKNAGIVDYESSALRHLYAVINPPKAEDLSRSTTLQQDIASLKIFILFQMSATLEV
jgi:hypothetical protein